eukprot:8754024-Pyramimonas_sp.AAC.1
MRGALLREVSKLRDTQAAFQFIRQRASHAELAYSMRTVPPELHRGVLQEFTANSRTALKEVLGAEIGDR